MVRNRLGLLLGLLMLAAGPVMAGAKEDWDAGLEAAQRGNNAAAVELYTRAIAASELSGEDRARLHYNRGIVLHRLREYDRAIGDYDQALQLKPTYPEALNNRGLVYADKGLLDRAIQDYDGALRLRSNDELAYFNRGYAYAERAIRIERSRITTRPSG